MDNLKNTLITIFVTIALVVGSIFIYENFIRKNKDNDGDIKKLEAKAKEYETEISNYRNTIAIRQQKIDSLEVIKNNLASQNDSLVTQINKTKNSRNEATTRVNNVNVDGLYKLFSEYQPR